MMRGAVPGSRPEGAVFTFEERVAASDALCEVYSGSDADETYFTQVLLPNLLPETYPESRQAGCTWIGAKAKASLHLSKLGLADHLLQLTKEGRLREETAYLCAAILDVPLHLQEAQIIGFRSRTHGS